MPSPLSSIQERIADLVDVPATQAVHHFVCSREQAEAVSPGSSKRGEVVLVHEDEEGLQLGVYVDDAALSTLSTMTENCLQSEAVFEAFCLAAEGVSHFHYLVFRQENTQSTSQLELELQAEVDTYAAALFRHPQQALGGFGAASFGRHHLVSRSAQLRQKLFSQVTFIDDATSVRGRRYRKANQAAYRYTGFLESLLMRGDIQSFKRSIRRFYRLGCRDKLAVCAQPLL